MAEPGARSDPRTTVLRDALVVFWLVLWLSVGALTGYQLWDLSRASEAAAASGRAADQAGEALQQLSDLPLVPDGPGQLGDRVREAAAEVLQSATLIREDVRRLSVLLGLSVALVPVAPVLISYLPGRLARRRYVGALRRTLRQEGRTAAVEAYLAHQAVQHLSYVQLAEVSRDPVADLHAGRHAALAQAEADRVGLSLPPPEPGGR